MRRLDASEPGFAAEFDALVNDRRESAFDVAADVAAIIARVKAEGDAALADYTAKFDRFDLGASGWSISKDECAAAYAALAPELRDALNLAAGRIRAYHAAQLPEDRDYRDDTGARLGARWRGVDAAGVYVPGGRAAYPSSVLMNIIPAKVAGVERIVMMTPTPGGETNPVVMAAAHIGGVDEIWRVGGAQAVAALAYGTSRIAPVDVVTGPGNAWVAEAKRQLYGVVGIDMVAGPSEIVVVADGKNEPHIIAADLLSQAEHDPTSQSILFTDDGDFADAVAAAVAHVIPTLSTAPTMQASWADNGAVIVVPTLAEAIPLCDRLAPEHLELAVDPAEADTLFAKVRHAGSVFLGRQTPEAIGDYVAGPNHVLPTGRRARFSSGLSVTDFMKRTSFLALDDASLAAIGPAAVALAGAEGLPAHALSVQNRLK
ncbi:MAG: histidinol dehydrogenase [Proteobacteria bacterium]|nr:histidinol dehydrogenase [Pseudomonadota bacterium]